MIRRPPRSTLFPYTSSSDLIQFLLKRGLFRCRRNKEIAGISVLGNQTQCLAFPSSSHEQRRVGFLDGLWGIVGMRKTLRLAGVWLDLISRPHLMGNL